MIQIEVPDEHSSARSREFAPRLAGILESLVDDLQELSLSGIHGCYL
jgi:hypothetical protein